MKAVFLDRDGTIIAEKEYLRDPAQVEILPGVPGALRRLQESGYLLILVTNQSGIGRGFFTMDDLERVNGRMLAELARDGVHIARIYSAPEAPDQPSRGRKPSPQFLWDARDEFGLDLPRCHMVGDKWIDLECGWNAGVAASILVRTGYGKDVERKQGAALGRAVVVDDLAGAVDWILGQAER